MATLLITNKSTKVWLHTPSDELEFIIGKFTFSIDGGFFQIVELGQSKRNKYSYTNVTIFDETTDTTYNSFASIEALSLQLETLGYIGFVGTGDIVSGVVSVNGQTGVVVITGANLNVTDPTTSSNATLNDALQNILDAAAGATEFTELTDTPSTYVGQGTKKVVVKSDESGLEFVADTSGGAWGSITGTLSSQTDLQNALNSKQDALDDINFGVFNNLLSPKVTPVDADLINITDSEDSTLQKKVTFTNVKAFLKTYFDAIYTTISAVEDQITSALIEYATETFVNAGLANKVDKNTAITGSTKTKITYDAKGLVTAGADASLAELTDDVTHRTVTDAQIASWNATIGGSVFQSVWNASTNTPTLASSVGVNGHYYIVNVAGSTTLNGISTWEVGDWAIFDGSVWRKVDNTDAVSSVNGLTGAVNLDSSNVPDTLNKRYVTDANLTKINAIDQAVSNAEKATWNGKQDALGFTPENTANKAINLTTPDNTKFPTTQAVANAINATTFTVELIGTVLTVDFYAPKAMRINTVTNLVFSPTTTLQVNNVAYTLTNLIAIGAKVTVTVSTASVINLNATYE